MSNKKKLDQRNRPAQQHRPGRGRHREPSTTIGDLVAIPGQVGVKILAAGALGSAALMVMQPGAASAAAGNTTAASPAVLAHATLTADVTPQGGVDPTAGVVPRTTVDPPTIAPAPSGPGKVGISGILGIGGNFDLVNGITGLKPVGQLNVTPTTKIGDDSAGGSFPLSPFAPFNTSGQTSSSGLQFPALDPRTAIQSDPVLRNLPQALMQADQAAVSQQVENFFKSQPAYDPANPFSLNLTNPGANTTLPNVLNFVPGTGIGLLGGNASTSGPGGELTPQQRIDQFFGAPADSTPIQELMPFTGVSLFNPMPASASSASSTANATGTGPETADPATQGTSAGLQNQLNPMGFQIPPADAAEANRNFLPPGLLPGVQNGNQDQAVALNTLTPANELAPFTPAPPQPDAGPPASAPADQPLPPPAPAPADQPPPPPPPAPAPADQPPPPPPPAPADQPLPPPAMTVVTDTTYDGPTGAFTSGIG
jgi:hypothetical protein